MDIRKVIFRGNRRQDPLPPLTTAPFLPDAHTGGWPWLLPRLAFALFIAAVVTLLFLSERAEREEQRATLISDILWLEQNLTFQFVRNEELLVNLDPGKVTSPGIFDAHARLLLDNGSGLRQVLWLNTDGTLRQSLPVETPSTLADDTARAEPVLARPTYTSPYAVGKDWWFKVHVPVFHDGRLAGIAVGAYSMTRMIETSVPWWLAERYRIVVTDTSGKVLASRSKVEAPLSEESYELALDPPGHGLSIQALPYRTPKPLVGRLLSGALVVLAVAVLWSLWALRRHVQRRLAAEHALHHEYAFRQAMGDSLQTGLRARDLEGRITYVNPAFCAMVGWTAGELIGRAPPMPYWVDDEIDATKALHDRILAGEGPDRGFEIHLKRQSGEVFPALIHEAPLIDTKGQQTGWMSSVIDISEQKRAEELARQQHERLQATARLVTMGEMASSLAHEINQPLAAIASYNAGCLNMLATGNANLHDIEGALVKSTEQAQRAGRIIRRIYSFVSRSEPKSEPCDITRLIEETMVLVESDARRNGIQLIPPMNTSLPLVDGDRVLLGQVFLNLVRNAIEAVKDMSSKPKKVEVTTAIEEDQIRVSIADSGPGIADNIASRLFEPFFTTKSEGMGMGLNICRSVVEGHHGRLWFESNSDGGTIFNLLLPIAKP